MPRVIKKNKSNPWNDVLGGIGQGLSGFTKGYMGRQQMDMAKENSGAMRDFYKSQTAKTNKELLNGTFGPNGENINTQYESALGDTLGGGQIPPVGGDMAGADAQTPALAPAGGMGMNMGELGLEELLRLSMLGRMGGA